MAARVSSSAPPGVPTPPAAPSLSAANPSRCLLDLAGVPADAVRSLLRRAHEFAGQPAAERLDTLRGRTVVNVFFEESTRTRLSFSAAAKRLGADVLDLAGQSSSVKKGESMVDTALTVEAAGADALVVRTSGAGAPHQIARAVRCAVLNAGDGRHAHPTQGLLDAYTLAEAHQRLDSFDLSGLTVVIVGDVLNSRVARSDVHAFGALGARVICCGPPALAPRSLARALGVEVVRSLDEALRDADAVQMLRIQRERDAAAGSLREYTAGYQLDERRAALMKHGAVVMHPGPMNRGVEITSAVADGPRSFVLRQVRAGVFVRMAALERCLGARTR